MTLRLSTVSFVAALALAGTLSACSPSPSQEDANTEPATTAEVSKEPAQEVRKVTKPDVAAEAEKAYSLIASGTFSGRSGHVTTGGVAIVRMEGKLKLVLAEDFTLDGAPAPVLGFGNGKYVESTSISKLNAISGHQVYDLPATIDPTLYSQVYVWCTQANAPLGVAGLTLANTDEALDDTYGS